MARTITSLAELKALAAETTVYARWEVDGAKGIARGYSVNHVSGTAEAGISVNELPLDLGDELLAVKVIEYRGICGNYGWIVTGDEIARGSDGEPILADVEIIAEIGDGLLAECDAAFRARWARQDAERLARPTFTPPASYGR